MHITFLCSPLYRAFHNVLRDYKHLLFTIWMRYGLNTKRLNRTLHTVVFDINSSLAAVPVDFFGLCRELARNRSTSPAAVNGRPLDFCLHRHPVSVTCLCHARMVFSVGGSFAYFARNAERSFSHYIHSHRLAA
jgi:hypothetical protein